jgi:hypothetical protein
MDNPIDPSRIDSDATGWIHIIYEYDPACLLGYELRGARRGQPKSN